MGQAVSNADPSRRAAVVIPYHRTGMEKDERASLERCRDVLARYDRYMVLPEGLDQGEFAECDPGLRFVTFAPEYFESAVGYNLLCRRPEFYERFVSYEFMLLCQLDAYVLDDRLDEWCGKGYDYVGAPWPNYDFQKKSRKPWAHSPILRPFLKRVGNGGFSLRRNHTLLVASKRLRFWVNLFKSIPEDVFWCNIAPYVYPFKIRFAPFEESLSFAFDADPLQCYQLTAGRLPFGCHGWNTDYREFWKGKIDALEA